MGGGVESSQGIDTPGVDELPQGGETSGVPTKDEGVPGEDGQGRGVDRNLPTNRATEESGDSGGDEGMTRGPGTAVLLIPQRVTAADEDSVGTLHRHSDGANGNRPKNGMQWRLKYVLLEPEELEEDLAAAGTQIIGAVHRAKRGVDNQGRTVTKTGDGTRQRALLARGMPEEDNGERRPPEGGGRVKAKSGGMGSLPV